MTTLQIIVGVTGIEPAISLLVARHTDKKDNKNTNKIMAYSSQGSHNGELDFCNWLTD